MQDVRRRRLVPLAVLGALAFASSAEGATKTVIAGPAGAVPGVFGPRLAAQVNAFSQKQVTIHVGDSVKWMIHGFHTITFNTKGAADIPFISKMPGATTYQGFADAAGRPFWFNGQLPREQFNPVGAFPQGARTEDGSKVTGSGLPLGPPKPFVLKFTKAGVFKYECVVHHGMDASVKVVPAGKPIPSAKADAKAVAKALASEAKVASALQSLKPPANTTTVSGGNDKGQVAVLKFFPETVHVSVGGTVKFVVTSKIEPHTFSFGPADYLKKLTNEGNVIPTPNPGGPPSLVLNPLFAFPSDPPPALPPFDGTAHGNGFLSTGVLQNGNPQGPPSKAAITFTKAGTYPFECLVHEGMSGKVIVG